MPHFTEDGQYFESTMSAPVVFSVNVFQWGKSLGAATAVVTEEHTRALDMEKTR